MRLTVSPRLRRCVLSSSIVLSACTGSIEPARSPDAGAPTGQVQTGADGGARAPLEPPALPGELSFTTSLRRLTRAELDNTLRDLLDDSSAPATKFLHEDEYVPFDNDYARALASPALIQSLDALSSDVAARALASPAVRARLVPCTPSGPSDAVCFRKVVEGFARRAFRRALSASELEPYMALLELARDPAAPNGFYTAVELFLRALLQDPEFLYRIEAGTPTPRPRVFALSSTELATRLAYLLWGSAPDDALLDVAARGELSDSTVRRAQAERMLEDERARKQLHRYHAMWLGYRTLPHPVALTTVLQRETEALLDRVLLAERRDYRDLFRFPETYVDATLAQHYGLSARPSSPSWVAYGDSGRAGILSHGSVLGAFSKFSDTSPTQRGIFVRTRLLCKPMGAPPANVNVDQAPTSDSSPCKTERYAAHRESASCAGCHNQIDPIGLGLERFDIAGRYRLHDDGLPHCSIEGKGLLPGVGAFTGPRELGEKIIASRELEQCAVRQLMTFTLGRELDANDDDAADALTRTFEAGKHDFVGLLLSIVASEAFGLRVEQ